MSVTTQQASPAHLQDGSQIEEKKCAKLAKVQASHHFCPFLLVKRSQSASPELSGGEKTLPPFGGAEEYHGHSAISPEAVTID